MLWSIICGGGTHRPAPLVHSSAIAMTAVSFMYIVAVTPVRAGGEKFDYFAFHPICWMFQSWSGHKSGELYWPYANRGSDYDAFIADAFERDPGAPCGFAKDGEVLWDYRGLAPAE